MAVSFPEPPPVDRDRNGPLLASLFLILLAFFVVLDAVSQRDRARVDAALRSLSATFQGADSEGSPVGAGAKLLAARRSLEAAIGETLRATWPGARFRVSRDGEYLRISLAEGALFAGAGAEVRLDAGGLLSAIARKLTVPELSELYRIDLLVTAPPAFTDRALRRAAALAERLREAGVRPDALAFGGGPGVRGQVRIELRLPIARAGRVS